MLVVNDGLDALLLGCFLFGLLFAALTLVLGGTHLPLGHGHVPSHGGPIGHGAGSHHGGHHSAHDARIHGSDAGLPLVNTPTVLAFVAWFGGIGYLARNLPDWPWPVSLALGVLGGMLAAAGVGWALSRLAAEDHRALDPLDYRLPGSLARVTSAIRSGGTGEIVYEQCGVRQVCAARAVDASAIPRGAEVVVLRQERGIALVERWEALVGEPSVEAGGEVHNAGPSRAA